MLSICPRAKTAVGSAWGREQAAEEQVRQASGGQGTQDQYLYCNTSYPHQLTGVYPLGTTCATVGGAHLLKGKERSDMD